MTARLCTLVSIFPSKVKLAVLTNHDQKIYSIEQPVMLCLFQTIEALSVIGVAFSFLTPLGLLPHGSGNVRI
jgi:hypothetical protein